ncbi:MAG: hypothetical protein JO363_22920 [Solirubrobacterales bacterium]|nr:hypothetical protein [Solirubrobacterales bacterium]
MTTAIVLACCNWVASQHHARQPICSCQMVCCTMATALLGEADEPASIWIVTVDCRACCTCCVSAQ